jgi:hypothetical protein
MAGFSEAVQAEDKIVTITKNCSKTHDSGWWLDLIGPQSSSI